MAVVVAKVEVPETVKPPDKTESPETVSKEIEVVAKVEVPITVKSNTPLMSPPSTNPLDKVVVANLPLMVMLSDESLPNTTSPFMVVVAVMVKSSEASRLLDTVR